VVPQLIVEPIRPKFNLGDLTAKQPRDIPTPVPETVGSRGQKLGTNVKQMQALIKSGVDPERAKILSTRTEENTTPRQLIRMPGGPRPDLKPPESGLKDFCPTCERQAPKADVVDSRPPIGGEELLFDVKREPGKKLVGGLLVGVAVLAGLKVVGVF